MALLVSFRDITISKLALNGKQAGGLLVQELPLAPLLDLGLGLERQRRLQCLWDLEGVELTGGPLNWLQRKNRAEYTNRQSLKDDTAGYLSTENSDSAGHPKVGSAQRWVQ